jgi:hypothetical protein
MRVVDFDPGGPLNVACPDCGATIALYCADASKTPVPRTFSDGGVELYSVRRPFGDYCDGRVRDFKQSLARDGIKEPP